jgi:hypothetical protein
LYGSVNVVEPVDTKPIRSVPRAMAARVRSGSSVICGASKVRSLERAGVSGRNRNWNLPRSAACAYRTMASKLV